MPSRCKATEGARNGKYQAILDMIQNRFGGWFQLDNPFLTSEEVLRKTIAKRYGLDAGRVTVRRVYNPDGVEVTITPDRLQYVALTGVVDFL